MISELQSGMTELQSCVVAHFVENQFTIHARQEL